MKKCYYVKIVNDNLINDDNLYNHEGINACKNEVTIFPGILYATYKKSGKNLLGKYVDKYTSEYTYAPMMCEEIDNSNYLKDVITGDKYYDATACSEAGDPIISETVMVEKVGTVNASDYVTYLEKFDAFPTNIIRYRDTIDRIKNNISLGYQRYLQEVYQGNKNRRKYH